MAQYTLNCPNCSTPCSARVRHVARSVGGMRVKFLEGQCTQHGIVQSQLSETAFEKAADLKLDFSGNVKCPKCSSNCHASVLNTSRALDGSVFKIIEADCDNCGLFYGTEQTIPTRP